jgi:hypothetical protein
MVWELKNMSQFEEKRKAKVCSLQRELGLGSIKTHWESFPQARQGGGWRGEGSNKERKKKGRGGGQKQGRNTAHMLPNG